MHVITHLSDKYEAMRNSENGWSEHEAGMAQLDDIVGSVMKKLKDQGLDDNTIVVFTTDNGAENFTWPDGGQTPFAGGKGTVLEGGFRVPAIVRWPGKVPAGKVENGIVSGLDWFPTLVAAAGDPNIVDELKAGKELDGQHLQGPPRRLRPDRPDHRQGSVGAPRGLLLRRGRRSAAVRIDDYKYRFIDQPDGWLGGTVKVDWPIIVNLRLDPFERTGMPGGGGSGSLAFYNWFATEFWRFVLRPAGSRQGGPDLHRLPADAEGRELQPGSGEGADRGDDRRAQRRQVAMNLPSDSTVPSASRRAFLVGATVLVAAPAGSALADETQADFLFVQTAKGMTYDKAAGRLTLTGVSPVTLFFADRPERIAGNMSTTKFVPFWSEGKDSFLSDPPNADVSIIEGGALRQTVAVLKDPELNGEDLSYSVDVIEGDMPATGAEVSVFIDVIGMPLTPVSYAGVARRGFRRAALY